jgi:hypothetical protein
MDFLAHHAEAVISLGTAALALLFRRQLAYVLGNRHIRAGLEIARGLEDGIDAQDIRMVIAGLKMRKALGARDQLDYWNGSKD